MSQQLLSTSDQKLDGRSRCPIHAFNDLRATKYDCEHCGFHKGYQNAVGEYRYQTSFATDIPFWEKRWEWLQGHLDRIGFPDCVTHYIWQGYMSYVMEKRREAYDHKEKRESVLKARENLKSELGPREFTFTYSPSWFATDQEAQSAMKLAIERLTKYYKDEIIEFHAVGEYTNAGASHVHAWYHLTGGRKITDKNFKRAYPRWNPKKKLGRGFEGGHHQTITRVADFAGYIEKHLEEAWLVVNINNANPEEEVSNASSSCGSSSSQSSEA